MKKVFLLFLIFININKVNSNISNFISTNIYNYIRGLKDKKIGYYIPLFIISIVLKDKFKNINFSSIRKINYVNQILEKLSNYKFIK